MVFNPAIVIEDITNRRNFKNNEFVCSTADCFATVFLAVNLIFGGKYVITEPLSVLRSNDKHIPSCFQAT